MIKEKPEDFIVREIADISTKESGTFAICKLWKKNYSTIRALEHIGGKLNKSIRDFSFGGTKDKKAITEQYISIKHISRKKIEEIELKDIKLEFIGFRDKAIFLGELKGNEFEILVKGVQEIKTERKFPNYYGEQRFSKHNVEIGRFLVKKEYDKALDLIKETSEYTSLEKIPKRLFQLFVHSFQSYLWNKTLNKYSGKEDIPLIGFGCELEGDFKGIIEEIMKEEDITCRSFIDKRYPYLSMEGGVRKSYVEIENLQIQKEGDNIRLKFFLEKGCYATVAIAFLTDSLDSFINNFI